MKITILGSGSAYGVPFVGGDWGNCDPSNSKNRRTTPSILIEDNGSKLLVDMGPDFKEHSITHQIRDLDGVIFTHAHADHIMGMYNLPIFMKYYQDQNLPLYADRFTRREIEKVFWYMFDPAINVEYSGPGRPLWHEVKHYYPLQVGNITVDIFLQNHGGRFKSLGLRVGDFAYSTDVSSFPEESLPYLQGLDVWVVDCNCEEAKDSSHSNLEQDLRWVDEFKPKQTYLTHLDYTVDYDTLSAKLPDNMALAYDGLIIEL